MGEVIDLPGAANEREWRRLIRHWLEVHAVEVSLDGRSLTADEFARLTEQETRPPYDPSRHRHRVMRHLRYFRSV